MAAPLQEVLTVAVSQRRLHPDYKDTRNVKSNNWKDVVQRLQKPLQHCILVCIRFFYQGCNFYCLTAVVGKIFMFVYEFMFTLVGKVLCCQIRSN